MMKKLILFVLLLLAGLTAFADEYGYMGPSQMAPHWGFVRKSPCATGNGDNCGSNPPTWHATPSWCGTVISTSAFRNADNSTSTKGARITLPTLTELTAAGYTAAGATGAGGTANREGQCEISFVQGLPLPGNYLRIGMDGTQGSDKVTFIAEGVGHDMFSGDMVFPAVSGTITVAWNGTSWLAKASSPGYAEKMGNGQMSSQGQGRLFVVTADPSWWTVGTKVGSLAYCPQNGLGTVTDSNGTAQLVQLPINCAFMDVPVGTSNDWITLRSIVSITGTAIAAGTAYGAGTAPDGTAYAAGNYVRVTVTSSVSLVSGTTMNIHNLPTTLGGSALNGKWIVQLIDATHIELHERVNDTNAQSAASVGPPSAFIGGDTLLAGVTNPVIGGYLGLTNTAMATARYTDPAQGTERENTNQIKAIVGAARHAGGVYADTITSRLVSSYFNAMPKPCTSGYTAARTTASLTFAEPNTESRCNFIYMNRASAQARSLGDVGNGVPWTLTVTASNATNGDGCEISVGFDGTTAEAQTAKILNPAGTNGASYSLTVHGVKTGLTETNHFATILARAITGGTCTLDNVGTSLTLDLMQ